MAEETIIADEQNEIDESNDEETSDDGVDVDVDAILAKNEKLEAELAKVKGRYKSQMKKKSETVTPKTEVNSITDDAIIEKKLLEIEERREFIKEFGEETFNEVKKIKDQHPTLGRRDALKISPIANNLAREEDPESLSMGGRPNAAAFKDSSTITVAELVKFKGTAQYSMLRDRISKGELTLKQ